VAWEKPFWYWCKGFTRVKDISLDSFYAHFSLFYFSFPFLFFSYYRLINKRFPGGSTSGTWRRRVTDFSGLLFRSCILSLQPATPVSVFWQSSRACARIIIQSPIRWKTFRRFAAGNEPSGPFFQRRRWRRPLFEYPMTMCVCA